MGSDIQNGLESDPGPESHLDNRRFSPAHRSRNRANTPFNGGHSTLWLALGTFTGTTKSGVLALYGPTVFWTLLALISIAVTAALYRSREELTSSDVDVYKVIAATSTRLPWFKIFAPLIALAAADISIDSSSLALHVSPHVLVTLKFLAFTAGITYSGIQTDRAAFHEGPTRARAIAASGLEGVSTSRLEIMDKHRQLAETMVRINAIDGVRLQARSIARTANMPVEDVLSQARELSDAGLARIAVLMNPDAPEKWLIELTEDGVKTLAARGR